MSMEVVSARSALLSNYEVLALLKELESEQLARQKTVIRIKKEEEEKVALGLSNATSSTVVNDPSLEDVCENLRTVEFEAIQYLTAEHQPAKYQSPESITQLTRDLNRFELTKAEKLQIINLAPTEPVEVYVIVEEIEDRLGDRMDEVLDVVRSSLTKPLFLPTGAEEPPAGLPARTGVAEGNQNRPGWEAGERGDAGVEDEFDDMGMGAGVEGDLEMGDDDD